MNDIATEKITVAQRKAIEALLTTGNMTNAAKAAGVNRATLYKWLRLPHFRQAMQKAETQAVESLARTLVGLGDAAATVLRDALQPGQKITVRLRAAEVVQSNLLRFRDLVDLERRIAALESGDNEEL